MTTDPEGRDAKPIGRRVVIGMLGVGVKKGKIPVRQFHQDLPIDVRPIFGIVGPPRVGDLGDRLDFHLRAGAATVEGVVVGID